MLCTPSSNPLSTIMEAPVKRSPPSPSLPPVSPLLQQQLQRGGGGDGGDAMIENGRDATLKRFSMLLGTRKNKKDNNSCFIAKGDNNLTSLLSSRTGEDAVVLTLPSLDVRLDNTTTKSDNSSTDTNGGGVTSGALGTTSTTTNPVLPNVGEHASGPPQFLQKQQQQQQRPSMTASVLSLANTSNQDDDDGELLDVVVGGGKNSNNTKQNNNVVTEEEAASAAALNIGKRTSWTKSTIIYAKHAVGTNLSDSFTKLLNSRLKAWTLLLLRHSLSTGNHESRSRLLSMLSAKISVTKAETTFQCLPLPESARGAKPKDADIVLPLLFEVLLQVNIQDKPETVTLRAPGTVSAIFDGDEPTSGLQVVHVRLDTSKLLKSMVDQARIVVLKAVAKATDTHVNLTQQAPVSPPTSQKASAIKPETSPTSTATTATTDSSTAALGSLRAAVNLPPSGTGTRMQKARSSALKLNSVLHGRSATSSAGLGVRKVRSVKWDPNHAFSSSKSSQSSTVPRLNSALAPNPNKRVRMVQTANKLKSFKSFGRPHAGDFGSGPRNATFGDYGRPGGGAGVWGRDGRLAHHPMPMQAVAAVDSMGNLTGGSADKNATFDLNKQHHSRGVGRFAATGGGGGGGTGGLSAAASAGAALLGRSSMNPTKTAAATEGGGASGSMPRTATALENTLMRKFA